MKRYRTMTFLKLTSHEERRARVRSLIQVGALAEKSGLFETFGLILGEDFQKAPHLKNQIASLYKGFLILDEMANSEDVDRRIWAEQGLAALANTKTRNE